MKYDIMMGTLGTRDTKLITSTKQKQIKITAPTNCLQLEKMSDDS